MVNKKEIDAYMSITAPESLKERVFSGQNKINNRISSAVRMCYALAAALLVIVAVFAFLPNGEAKLYCGDIALNKNAVIVRTAENPNARIALLSTRDIEDIPFTIETDSQTTVKVSHGELCVIDGDNAKNAGQKITLDDDTDFLWSVELNSDIEAYTLTVETKRESVSYCISQNSKAQWVLSKK